MSIILTRDSEPSELLSMVKKIRLKNVHIKSDSPYVTIELTRLWAKLYVGSSEDKSAGIFYNLDQILSSRNRSSKWLYNYLFLWILSGIFVLANIPIFLLKIDLCLITLITSVYFIWVSG